MKKHIHKVIRTFHPVGHGAFYTEYFESDGFLMLYDCGAKKGKTLFPSLIDVSLKNRTIDLLVISHFHDDHVNGLEHILKSYNVEKILLPLLDPIEKINLYFFNIENNSSSFIQNLCESPEKAINAIAKSVNIDFVYVRNNDNVENVDIEIQELKPGKINSGDKIIYKSKDKTFQWVYVPFNYDYKNRNLQIVSEFQERKIPIDIDQFKIYYLANKDKIKEAYSHVKGNLNTNSLTLYSCVDTNSIQKSIGHYSRGFKTTKYYMRHEKIGCLYLGDYKAADKSKWGEFEKVYRKYFKNVSIIQIPHHGSVHNYNTKLNFENNLISIISAPIKHNKHHPSEEVIKQITINNSIPIVVTEDEATIFIQKISLYLK